jgi:hypothetical protein
MQTKKWVRVGVAGIIAGSALGGVLAAGCGGNDQGSGGNGNDAGDSSTPKADAPTSIDTGVVDTGVEAEAAAPPVLPKVYLVNAAVDALAPPLRFCFGLGNPADGGAVQIQDMIPPFPDSPVSSQFPIAGLFPGFGGLVSSPKLDTFDLSKLTVSLYAIDATKIATDTADGGPDGGAEVPCEGLIGTDALGKASDAGGGTLTQGTDYWYLGTVSMGQLPHGTTWIAEVAGCAPGETVDNVPFCGGPPTLPAYSAVTGNLTLIPLKLDSTTNVAQAPPEAGTVAIGAQFANASPAWDYSVKAAGGTTTAAGFWMATQTPPAGTDGGLDAGDGGGASPLDSGNLVESGSLVDSGILPDTGSLVDAGILPDSGSLFDSSLVDSGSLLDGSLGDASLLDSDVEAGPTTTSSFSFVPITSTGTFGTLSPMTLNTTAGAIPLNAPNAGFAALIPGPSGVLEAPAGCTVGATTNGCFSPLLFPLPDVDSITNGAVLSDAGIVTAPVGGSFAYGKGYVFVLIGDPNQTATSGGGFNGKSLHFLAFPTSNP